jgi:hypothetical protein
MRRRRLALPLVLAGLALAGCHLFDAEEKIPVPFESMEEAAYLCVSEASTRVFRDEAEWQEFWEQNSAEQAPEVEFGRETVAGIFYGGGYSGCSNRADVVRSVTELTSEVKVDVDPLNDLGDCEMIVCPAQLIRLPRIDKPFRFIGEVPE